MNIGKVLKVTWGVMTDWRAIVAFVGVFGYWSLINKILYYRKRPPRPKVKRSKPSAAPAQAAPPAGDDTGGAELSLE